MISIDLSLTVTGGVKVIRGILQSMGKGKIVANLTQAGALCNINVLSPSRWVYIISLLLSLPTCCVRGRGMVFMIHLIYQLWMYFWFMLLCYRPKFARFCCIFPKSPSINEG